MEIDNRYSVVGLCDEKCSITKNPREIFLLRGNGCKWRKCRFCDYHYDFSTNEAENFSLNKMVLDEMKGAFGVVEIINSGSFCDLDDNTMNLIKEKCIENKIRQIHFECHWKHIEQIEKLREDFKSIGVRVKIKIGVETFDYLFRESYLSKGIDTDNPQKIAQYADEVCLLQGLPAQTVEFMKNDIEIGLKYFERVCVNIMCKNSKPIMPDNRVIGDFIKYIYPLYINNPRVDILLNNTDFGVGK